MWQDMEEWLRREKGTDGGRVDWTAGGGLLREKGPGRGGGGRGLKGNTLGGGESCQDGRRGLRESIQRGQGEEREL